jgi:hypothetical protein
VRLTLSELERLPARIQRALSVTPHRPSKPRYSGDVVEEPAWEYDVTEGYERRVREALECT